VDRGPQPYPPGSFLGALSAGDREVILGAGHIRTHRTGATLCREGDPPIGVHIVLTGVVKLTKTAPSGREALLELRGAGDVLGDMSVVDGERQSANAIATGDVEVLAISGDDFEALLGSSPAIARSLLRVVVRRLRQASDRQLELGTTEVMGRVCARLAELAATRGEPVAGGVLIRGALSQQELADWSGASRDGVVRAFNELRDLGVIDSGRGRVLIRDIGTVRNRAGLGPHEKE
jgi:CRP/FNR family transcriptional regulator, cyclic AMP receptor protein